MLARQVTLSRRTPSSNSFVPIQLPPLFSSCLSFASSRRLFSIACSLFLQNRGVGITLFPAPPQEFRPTPLLPITSLQPLQFHAITHSFAQRPPAKPFHIRRLRTLFIATWGGYPLRRRSPLQKAGATTALYFEAVPPCNCERLASTSSLCLSGFTSSQTFCTLPCGSIKKVWRAESLTPL